MSNKEIFLEVAKMLGKTSVKSNSDNGPLVIDECIDAIDWTVNDFDPSTKAHQWAEIYERFGQGWSWKKTDGFYSIEDHHGNSLCAKAESIGLAMCIAAIQQRDMPEPQEREVSLSIEATGAILKIDVLVKKLLCGEWRLNYFDQHRVSPEEGCARGCFGGCTDMFISVVEETCTNDTPILNRLHRLADRALNNHSADEKALAGLVSKTQPRAR